MKPPLKQFREYADACQAKAYPTMIHTVEVSKSTHHRLEKESPPARRMTPEEVKEWELGGCIGSLSGDIYIRINPYMPDNMMVFLDRLGKILGAVKLEDEAGE